MVESLTFSMGQLQRGYLSLVNKGQDNFTENDAAYGRREYRATMAEENLIGC